MRLQSGSNVVHPSGRLCVLIIPDKTAHCVQPAVEISNLLVNASGFYC